MIHPSFSIHPAPPSPMGLEDPGHHGIVVARLWRPVATPRPAQRTSAAAWRGERAAKHGGRWRGTAENLAEMGYGDGSKPYPPVVHIKIAGIYGCRY